MGQPVEVRAERPGDAAAIGALVTRAFAAAPHASGTEAAILAGLRREGALALSRVAVRAGRLIGQAAFSPVSVNGRDCGWFGCGPVAVEPDGQRRGTGSALMREGLDRLRARGAGGCVVLGDPRWYGRFGFAPAAGLWLADVPAGFFLALPLADAAAPGGEVVYHPAFGA